MAKQDVIKFWEKVSEDTNLQRKLEAEVKPDSGWDAVVAFGKANGFSFTTEDYGEAVKSLPKQLGAEGYTAWKKGETVELDEKELERVAGGVALSSFSRLSQTVFSFESPYRSLLQPYEKNPGGFSTALL